MSETDWSPFAIFEYYAILQLAKHTRIADDNDWLIFNSIPSPTDTDGKETSINMVLPPHTNHFTQIVDLDMFAPILFQCNQKGFPRISATESPIFRC